MPRRLPVLPALLASLSLAGLLAALAGCSSSPPPPSPKEPATFTVDVGWEDVQKGIEAESFFPRSLSVNVGDTVVFTARTHEPHTVTFNAPAPLPQLLLLPADGSTQVNPVILQQSPASADRKGTLDGTGLLSSGLLSTPGDAFTVSAAVPGTFAFVCLFHSDVMKGTLIVNPKSTPRPMGDADYRLAAEDRVKDLQARAADLRAGTRAPDPQSSADGHEAWTVYAGVGSSGDGIDLMKFIGGENLVVKAGDSVTFEMSKNAAGAAHTVTFLAGTPAPDLLLPAAGSSMSALNPKVIQPTPAAPYDGSRYANSGLMIAGGSTPQGWTVTFAAPGTYAYQCLLHAGEGMKGTVTVRP